MRRYYITFADKTDIHSILFGTFREIGHRCKSSNDTISTYFKEYWKQYDSKKSKDFVFRIVLNNLFVYSYIKDLDKSPANNFVNILYNKFENSIVNFGEKDMNNIWNDLNT